MHTEYPFWLLYVNSGEFYWTHGAEIILHLCMYVFTLFYLVFDATLPTFPGIKAVSGNLMLLCVFALEWFKSALPVCLLSLSLNCGWTWSNLFLWCGPFSLKWLPPPSLLIKRQWETGGTTSYTRLDSAWPGGYHNVYTPTQLQHRWVFKLWLY